MAYRCTGNDYCGAGDCERCYPSGSIEKDLVLGCGCNQADVDPTAIFNCSTCYEYVCDQHKYCKRCAAIAEMACKAYDSGENKYHSKNLYVRAFIAGHRAAEKKGK